MVYTWAYRNGGWVIVFSHDDHGRKAGGIRSIDFGNVTLDPTTGILNSKPSMIMGEEITVSKGAAAASGIERELLKNKRELAMLAVKEKQLLLEVALEKKADRGQIELLKIELERARLLLHEAELNLSAATKKGQSPPAGKTSR
jgi:hypothetical protein